MPDPGHEPMCVADASVLHNAGSVMNGTFGRLFPASVNGLYYQESPRLNQDSGRPSGIGYMQMNHSFSDTCAPACD